MDDAPTTNAEDAVRFLEWKRPDGPWPVTAIAPDGGRTPTTWLDDAEAVREFVGRHSGRVGLYYTVGEVRPGVEKKPSKADLVETRCLHVDLDPPKGISPGAIDGWVKTELARVAAQTHSPPPSVVVRSGNGLHLLWALDEPLFLGGAPERIADVEERTRALCVDFGADGSTWNADRLLRLPGTINLPNARKREAGRQPRATAVESLRLERVYSLADFRCEPDAERQPRARGSAGKGLVAREEVARLADPNELEQWGVPLWARAVIVEGTDPTEPERWSGDRSAAQWAVTCELARRRVPAGLIVGVLTDATWGVAAHVIAQKRPLDYAWRQVEKAVAAAEAEGERFDTDKNGTPYPSQHNIRLALSKMGVRVQYDQFADRAALTGLDGFGPHLNDAALTRLRLRADEEHKLKVGKEFFCDVVEDAARRDAFHPVVDYLDGLVWDGKPRLDGWMTAYLQADGSDYTRHVGTIMLVAAVRRVRQPGCKFDEMVVLESEQGKAKSSALAILAVQEDWFSDDLPLNAEAKLVIERTQGRWLIEAGELKGMSPKGIEHLKGFLSRRRDSSRMAYGRLTHDAPRHFIVVGTTNDERYLIDSTGNRRFLPVRVGEIDLDALARDRDQLWAEAAAREAAGASIRLDRSLWQAAALEQDERRTVDPFVAPLADVFRDLQGKVAARDVWRVIGTALGQRTPEQERRVGVAMRDLGFTKGKARFGGPNPENSYRRGDDEDRPRRILVVWVPSESGKDGIWEAYLDGDDLPGRQEALPLERDNEPY